MAQALDSLKPTNDTGITDTVTDLAMDRICELADKANGEPSGSRQERKPRGSV